MRDLPDCAMIGFENLQMFFVKMSKLHKKTVVKMSKIVNNIAVKMSIVCGGLYVSKNRRKN